MYILIAGYMKNNLDGQLVQYPMQEGLLARGTKESFAPHECNGFCKDASAGHQHMMAWIMTWMGKFKDHIS